VVRRPNDRQVWLRDGQATAELAPCMHVLWLGVGPSGCDRQDDPEDSDARAGHSRRRPPPRSRRFVV